MDPNHPSNSSIVPGRGTPPNPSVLVVRPINQTNNVYFHPQFQPRPQFQPPPQPQQQTPPSSQLALVPAPAQPPMNYPPYDDVSLDLKSLFFKLNSVWSFFFFLSSDPFLYVCR